MTERARCGCALQLTTLLLAMASFAAHALDCAQEPGPREAVLAYGKAMQEKRFEDAYDHVSKTMTDGRPREEWAALQRKMFELGGVELQDPDVRRPRRALVDGKCADVAQVPNVLRAKDVLNNQGSTEFEVYTVVFSDGAWRVDSQETLFDEPRIREWFPDDEIPAFQDTAPTN
jgi:hypothetical protein